MYNHAYAIVGAAVVEDDGKEYFLIKLYNPWRDDSFFKGPFNDNDPIWNKGDPKNKDKLNYKPDPYDGI